MADALLAPIWLGVNLLLLRAGWETSRKLFPADGLLQRVSQVILFWWACIASAGTLLGAFGLLSGYSLLAAGAGLAALSLWGLRSRPLRRWLAHLEPGLPGPGMSRSKKLESSGSLDEGGPHVDRSPQLPPSERFWLALWGVWVAYTIGRVVLEGLLQFPKEWDTLMYHLPLVNQWLHAGSLYAPNDAVWYNPGNSELVGLWIVAPFSGDFLISLINLPAILLLIASGVELGTNLGLRRWFSHVVTLALVTNEVVFRQMLDAKNDVAVASLFLALLAFGFRFLRQGRLAVLLFAAVAFGLLCGVKYYAVGYAGVAGMALLILAWAFRGRRTAATVGLAVLCGGLLWAGYWYGRNAWVTGTPIYPKGVTKETDLVMGVRPELWSTTLLGNGRPEVLPLAVKAVEVVMGPCHVVAVYLLPAILTWLGVSGLWLWWRQGKKIEAAIRWALGFLVVGTGLILGLTPFAVEVIPGTLNLLLQRYHLVRFGLCFLSVTLFGLAVLAEDISQSLRGYLVSRRAGRLPGARAAESTTLGVGATLAVCLPQLGFAGGTAFQLYQLVSWKKLEDYVDSLLLGLNLVLLGITIFLCWQQWPRRGRAILLPGCGIALLIGVAFAVNWLGHRWHQGFAAYYDKMFGGQLFQALAEKDPRTTRICVIGNRYYPFFGSRRQFAVSRPGYMLSLDQILGYLRDRDPTLVAAVRFDRTYAGTGRYDRCGDWLAEHPHLFQPVWQPSWGYYRVWQVDQPALERATESEELYAR